MSKILSFVNSLVDSRLDFNNLSLISNNCWGYEIFKNSDIKYNTPFVGLFVYPNDYLKLLQNPKFYLEYPLKIEDFVFSDYPIARIHDIDIHFLHYDSNYDALSKWNRRRLRLLNFIDTSGFDQVIVKFCNRDNPTKKQVEDFQSLSYKRKIYLDGSVSQLILDDKNIVFSGKKLYSLRFLYPIKFRGLIK